MYKVLLSDNKQLNIDKTFQCGQCFRWIRQADGSYEGVVNGSFARLWCEDEKTFVSSTQEMDWKHYFDLYRDYEKANDTLRGFSDYLDRCIAAGEGIRILNQDPWETLISFIISQCNNISRIQGIVDRMCRRLGNPIYYNDRIAYTFPTEEQILASSAEDWAYIKAGYRAKYIVETSKCIASGYGLDELIDLPWEQSRDRLMELPGVGVKVANCVNLFGLRHIESFPMDTWIKKALKAHFPEDFDPVILGEFAGLAQQYIFDYERVK